MWRLRAHRPRRRLAGSALALAVVASAGCQPAQDRAATGAAPTSPSRAAVTSGTGATAAPSAAARYAPVPSAGGTSFGDRMAFPPRNEPFPMTAYGTHELSDEALALGALGVVNKPFEPNAKASLVLGSAPAV